MGDNGPQPEVRAPLAPGDLVRIFLGEAGAIMFQYRGGLADARGPVAAVLASIDRQILIAELRQALCDGALRVP